MISTYKTYSFKDKDPMIDRLRTVLQDEYPGGRKGSSKINYGLASSHSGVSETTLRNWFEGETRRPQFASMCATARGAGHDLVLVPTAGRAVIEIDRIIKRSAQEAREERQARAARTAEKTAERSVKTAEVKKVKVLAARRK